jgi:threonine synthase
VCSSDLLLHTGVTSYAGVKKAAERGLIDPAWTIVVLMTGSGLKDIASVMKVAGEPRPVAADASALKAIFT